MSDIREALIERGWKQGSLIRFTDDPRFSLHAHFSLGADDIFVVVSQTCDLVNPSLENEPVFEVLRLKPIEGSPDTNAVGGKNSRVLQFSMAIGGGDLQSFQVLPFERFFVGRSLLLEHFPVSSIADELMDVISAWLVKRYIRTAFPDEYDRRWKQRRSQIEKIIKRMVHVRDIYIALNPFSEADDGIEYEVSITLLMDAGDFDNAAIYDECDKQKNSLEDQFNRCDGIDLQAIEIVSDAEITLRELEQLSRWDYSYLSYRSPEEHSPPVGVC